MDTNLNLPPHVGLYKVKDKYATPHNGAIAAMTNYLGFDVDSVIQRIGGWQNGYYVFDHLTLKAFYVNTDDPLVLTNVLKEYGYTT
jgi:hypothetical protein